MKKYLESKTHLLFLNFHNGAHDKSQAATPHDYSYHVAPPSLFSLNVI